MPLDTPPLVGRARLLLLEICDRAQRGVGTVLIGPSGSGGTRALVEASAALRRSGVRIARLSGVTAGAAYTAFLALLDPATSATVLAADQQARPALLRKALESLGLQAVAVDDAATLPEPMIALLNHLAQRGVALVANASGPVSMPTAFESLASDGRIAVTPLPRLSDAEVNELAEHLLLDPVDAELAHALADASDGRPGTLTEVVHDAVATGSIVHVDGVWHLVGPLPAPRTIRSEVRDRFSALPPDQRGWVAAVAVAGALAADLAPRIAGSAVAERAERAGWTRHDVGSGTVRMASVPARTSVRESLGVGARVAVLRRLVDALGAVDRALTADEHLALARWRIELDEPTDPEELLALATAPGADRDAQELLLRAAVAGGAQANAALADLLRRTRRPDEALALIRAARSGERTGAERTRLARVEAMTTGVARRRSGEALAALDLHIDEHGQDPDLLAVRSALLLLEGRPRESHETAERVLAAPRTSAFAVSFSRLQVAMSLRELGLLRESREVAVRFAADEWRAEPFPDAQALARWLPHEVAVAVAVELAEADAALADLHGAASADRRAEERPLYAYTLGCIQTQQGDPLAAAQLLRDADGGPGAWRDAWRPRILAELSIAQSLAGAVEAASGTLDRVRRIGCPPLHEGRLQLAEAQLSAARGDRGRAAATAAAVGARAAAAGLRLDAFDAELAALRWGDRAAADRLLALGPDPAGEGRDAQRIFAGAVRAGDPAAMDDAAVRLWAVGQRLHAVEAAAAAAEAGSDAAARRLVGWLARTPGLVLPARAAGRPIGLTAREREVARLAAAGVPDRTIATRLGITVRTAQTHLGRAFAKLGVHRRTELRGLIDDA